MAGERDVLMPAQAAALLGVTRPTLVQWARKGRLPAVRTLGGHRRYRRADVVALLRELADDRDGAS